MYGGMSKPSMNHEYVNASMLYDASNSYGARPVQLYAIESFARHGLLSASSPCIETKCCCRMFGLLLTTSTVKSLHLSYSESLNSSTVFSEPKDSIACGVSFVLTASTYCWSTFAYVAFGANLLIQSYQASTLNSVFLMYLSSDQYQPDKSW